MTLIETNQSERIKCVYNHFMCKSVTRYYELGVKQVSNVQSFNIYIYINVRLSSCFHCNRCTRSMCHLYIEKFQLQNLQICIIIWQKRKQKKTNIICLGCDRKRVYRSYILYIIHISCRRSNYAYQNDRTHEKSVCVFFFFAYGYGLNKWYQTHFSKQSKKNTASSIHSLIWFASVGPYSIVYSFVHSYFRAKPFSLQIATAIAYLHAHINNNNNNKTHAPR